jgi:hypothetical protein
LQDLCKTLRLLRLLLRLLRLLRLLCLLLRLLRLLRLRLLRLLRLLHRLLLLQTRDRRTVQHISTSHFGSPVLYWTQGAIESQLGNKQAKSPYEARF